MSWMDALGGLMKQAGGQADPTQATSAFEQLAGKIPSGVLGGGLADLFRGPETPPTGQLVGQLFGNSSGDQKAGMLNALIAAAGPSLLSSLVAGGGAGALLSQLTGGGTRVITPAQASQLSPEAVTQIVGHAEQHNPTIVDQLGSFYAGHPGLVKTLGGAVLSVALAKMANRK